MSTGLAGLIAHHEREGKRKAYRIGANINDSIMLDSILEQPLAIDEFPSYNWTCIPYADTDDHRAVHHDVASWKAALSNVKGIYFDRQTRTPASTMWARRMARAASGNAGVPMPPSGMAATRSYANCWGNNPENWSTSSISGSPSWRSGLPQ